MRVLVVPKWYPWPDRPVLGVFCREQARVVARDHDVVVLASDAVVAPPFWVFELSDRVEGDLRTLRLRYRRPRFRPAAMACQLAGMLAALRRLRRQGWSPELIHAHVYSAGLPAVILGWVTGAPVVVSEHYTGFQRGLITGYDRFTARLAFRYADLVAPVSQDLARYVGALEPRARIQAVDNVVDTGVFHPGPHAGAPPPGRPPRLLTVAALAEKKGHADLLEALARLAAEGSDATLDLVGDGELRLALEARSRQLGLAARVRFHGQRLPAEVAELMRQADLFVLPSHFENSPVVLIEAMASGLPAVATSVGGVPELAEAAPAGLWLAPPGDPAGLAKTIAHGLAQRGRVDPAALAAAARTRFGCEKIGATWNQIYQELRR